ncbi:MAG: hypothetical protein R3C11_18735 [Planctomycetaceae bacterium]
MPEELLGKKLTREEAEPGRKYFVLIETRVEEIDFLRLSAAGSLRARMSLSDSGHWQGEWLAP